MKKILILFLLISSTVSAQKKLDKLLDKWNTRNVPYMSVETLAMPKTAAILLDARDEKEFNVSHLENAIRVGYDDFKTKETIAILPKDKSTKIVVYCSLGIRSETVAHKLIQGRIYQCLQFYMEGIFEWEKCRILKVIEYFRENPPEKVPPF